MEGPPNEGCPVIRKNSLVISQTEVRRQKNLANHESNPSNGNFCGGAFYSEGLRGAGERGLGFEIPLCPAYFKSLPSLISSSFSFLNGA